MILLSHFLKYGFGRVSDCYCASYYHYSFGLMSFLCLKCIASVVLLIIAITLSLAVCLVAFDVVVLLGYSANVIFAPVLCALPAISSSPGHAWNVFETTVTHVAWSELLLILSKAVWFLCAMLVLLIIPLRVILQVVRVLFLL